MVDIKLLRAVLTFFLNHKSWVGNKYLWMILNIHETENNQVFQWQCLDFDTEIKLSRHKMNPKKQAWSAEQTHWKKWSEKSRQHMDVGKAHARAEQCEKKGQDSHSAALSLRSRMLKWWRHSGKGKNRKSLVVLASWIVNFQEEYLLLYILGKIFSLVILYAGCLG